MGVSSVVVSCRVCKIPEAAYALIVAYETYLYFAWTRYFFTFLNLRPPYVNVKHPYNMASWFCTDFSDIAASCVYRHCLFGELGGNVTLSDLENYESRFREAVNVTLRNGQFTVFNPPPPSSGVVLDFMLAILDGSYHCCGRFKANVL